MKKSNNQVFEMLGLIGQIAVTMLVPIVALTWFGWWAGGRLSHPGAGSVIGFAIGAITGMQSVWRILRKYLRNQKSPGQLARERSELKSESVKEIK